MNQFNLSFFKSFETIKAASGIISRNNKLYIISDDSDILYIYDLKIHKLSKKSLCENGALSEHLPKSEKSDFEAIVYSNNHFFVFGSGSLPNRNKLAIISEKDYSLKIENLTDFYNRLKTFSGIDNENFNIEGAIIIQDILLLFQRGNGSDKINGIFKIQNWRNTEEEIIDFFLIPLPLIGNSSFTFTDAIYLEEKIYFVAAAEASNSTYDDGEILGSMIGIINPTTLEVEKTQIISSSHKFEGLTFISRKGSFKNFLICEDPDDDEVSAGIYELKIRI